MTKKSKSMAIVTELLILSASLSILYSNESFFDDIEPQTIKTRSNIRYSIWFGRASVTYTCTSRSIKKYRTASLKEYRVVIIRFFAQKLPVTGLMERSTNRLSSTSSSNTCISTYLPYLSQLIGNKTLSLIP